MKLSADIFIKLLKKGYLIIIFLFLFICFFYSNNAELDIQYDTNGYTGQATMYYASQGEEFKEENSIYTSVSDSKARFRFADDAANIFFVPNRVQGQTAGITSIKIYCGNIFLASLDAQNIYDMLSNKDASYISYDNGTLYVTSSEETPYPAFQFDGQMPEYVNRLHQACTILYVILSLMGCFIVYAAIKLYYFCVKKFNISGKSRAVAAFNVISLVIIFSSLCYFNLYDININFEDPEDGKNSVIYYDYDDSKLKEVNSSYYMETKNTGFIAAGGIEQLRLHPVAHAENDARIKGFDLYRDGIKLKSYTPEETINLYSLQTSPNITMQKGVMDVVTDADNINSFITYNYNFLDDINGVNIKSIFADISKLVVLYLLMTFSLFMYRKGKSSVGEVPVKTSSVIILGILSIIGLLLCRFLELVWLVYIFAAVFVPLFVYLCGKFGISLSGKRNVYCIVGFVLCAVLLLNSETSFLFGTAFFDYAFWDLCIYILMSLCYISTVESFVNKGDNVCINNISGIFVKIFLLLFIYEYMKYAILYQYPSIQHSMGIMLGYVMQLNFMWAFLFMCIFYGIFGNGITNLLGAVFSFFLLAGNAIKMTYHNTTLTPADFRQIGDAFAFAPEIVGKGTFCLILILCAVLVLALILNIKRILPHLKPVLFIWISIVCIGCLWKFSQNLINDVFFKVNVCDKPYIDEVINEHTNGTVIYNMFKILHISDMNMKEPEGYSEEYVKSIADTFPKCSVKDDTRPNVICILAESFFDLNSIPDYDFGEDLIKNTRDIGFTTMISPRYGGYTAAVEYEVLTGESLAFYPPGVIPYSSYFTDKKDKIPSVPMAFSDNGYKTYVIHPNTPNFYNRENAYKMMGFDKYYSIEDFEGAEITKNNFVTDMEVADKIISTIEDNKEPVFTFGITIESHFTGDIRYDSTDTSVKGEHLTESDITDLTQQSQAYKHMDEMIGHLKEYVDNCKEPTIVYIFGDHLPPVSNFAGSSYLNSGNNKYRTISLCFSNYKDVSLKDMTTPNYIAAQMVVDSGVKHSSYFDFIYSLKDTMPILHSEFTDMDTENNEDLKKYYLIQYDLLFGEHYFYGK